MKKLKIHVGSITTFLKWGYGNYCGYGNSYGFSDGCGEGFSIGYGDLSRNLNDDVGYGSGSDYYKIKDRQLVSDEV